MLNQRFHRPDTAYIQGGQQLLERGREGGTITSAAADLIAEFVNELAGKIGAAREYKMIGELILNQEFFPPYPECTTAAALSGVRQILVATDENGNPRYKKNTITDRVKIAKRFFLWMCENGYGHLDEKKLQKITPPSPDRMTKTADDILSEEEVHRMKEVAWSSRDRAIISVLYEGGLRASELGSLVWGDLRFTPQTVVLNTAGKTGKPRYIPLIESRTYLAAWRNDYPGNSTDPNAFVFVTARTRDRCSRPLTYSAVAKILRVAAEEAGITKKITPHILRHSRITHLIRQGVPETHIKRMMWGSLTTDMFQTYAHLTNDDLDSCMTALYGIKIPGKEEEKEHRKKVLEPRQCPECATVNGSTMNFCGTCGCPLTDEAKVSAVRAKDELQRLMQEPEMLLEAMMMVRDRREAREGKGSG
ncbi:MAG: site-specific integrase [Methanocorpusculum sp.]|nr:site-specific integrase [Methanocorpusculum sp.]